MISGEQIELILAIVEAGSFSAAARRLGRTPSAISMAIGNLEADLGFQLFDRSRREPVPTPELLALMPDARLIAERLNALRLQAQHLGEGVEAALSIGVTADLDPAPVIRAVGVVSRAFPSLEIDLLVAPQDEVIRALSAGQIDACIAYGDTSLSAQELIHGLWTETLVAVAAPSHDLARVAHLSIEDLKAYRQIVIASATLPISESRPPIGVHIWKVSTVAQALALTEAGTGWSDLPRVVVAESVRKGRLIHLGFRNIQNGLQLPVFFRSLRGRPLLRAARLLLDELRAGPR